jgi:hypothetical protein
MLSDRLAQAKTKHRPCPWLHCLYPSTIPSSATPVPPTTTPTVTSAPFQQITHFWLTGSGIDGFRLDAIGSLIESGPVTVETEASHYALRLTF